MKESTKIAIEKWNNYALDSLDKFEEMSEDKVAIDEFFRNMKDYTRALENDPEVFEEDPDLKDIYEMYMDSLQIYEMN